ncbi:MAG: aldehyde dehydrogenase, partial [Bdellovibrionales bacterium]|nr:aldehyde dehydrogenase [Bdellovibrionales bacterium]
MSRLRVGINGFGRIGRILFRAGFDRFDIVGINNLGDAKQAAHLLKYDSTHGQYGHTVQAGENEIVVSGRKIPLTAEKDPAKIPWKDWGADIVLECTGVFKQKEDFLKHVKAGAKRVLVSAPADGADLTIVYGINHESYKPEKHHVLSNASCTTNSLAPVAKVLNDSFGIERGYMTTIHSYTNDQMVLDAFHKDLRRARSAAVSMIPTTTGAAKAVGIVLPELKGKIDGVAIRVPTPDASLVDLVFETSRELSFDSITTAFKDAASGPLRGILRC